jgi:NitT/TauT family transport system permease protein
MLFPGNKVNGIAQIEDRPQREGAAGRSPGDQATTEPFASKARWRILAAVPLSTVIALAAHAFAARQEPPGETQLYTDFLSGLLAAAVVFLTGWELATSGFRWLPLPYFPSPAGVLQSLVTDRDVLSDSAWRSLLLLLGGYTLGVAAGLFSGICIGWFPRARYWGMPLLKIIGPIPATAWIPLAMVISPSAPFSAVALIALAVWFPVTMLTASGVSNTRASYLDVARTLGAGRAYLIFHGAIPAAMPSIFIGLFMGLGASFLTLVVAETVGVKAGLGWYVSWAQGWAEYGKVYAALVIMAAFFSTLYNGAVQGPRPRARLAERDHRMVGQRSIDGGAAQGSSVCVREVTKDFAARDGATARTLALDGISLLVEAGELVSIVGPSGCGKSTLLRLIAGLDLPTSGELRAGTEVITGPNAARGLVFQDPNLFPWLTVRRAIQAGLVALGVLHRKRHEVDGFIRLVGLEGFADAYPHHLSGGMAQRVALARALITHPKVLQQWRQRQAGSRAPTIFPSLRGNALTRDSVHHLLGEIVRVAITACPSLATKRVSPHVVRYRTAMHLLQSGVDITVIDGVRLLGITVNSRFGTVDYTGFQLG